MVASGRKKKKKPTLYTCVGSRGLRVTWAAEELGLDLDLVALPFPPRVRAAGYRELNPLGTVPALVEGDVVMTESSAILQYLVTRDGLSPLAVASDEPDYPMFLDWLHHADATLTFPQTVFMRFARFERERGLEAAGEAYLDWFFARLVKAERRLAAHDYLCAGRFTAADIAVGYALYLPTMIGTADRLPAVLRGYLDRITARPAFARALAREAAAAETDDVNPVHARS